MEIVKDGRSTNILFPIHHATYSVVWSLMHCTNERAGLCDHGDFLTRDGQCVHLSRDFHNTKERALYSIESWADARAYVCTGVIDLTPRW